jgi:hypothetical protein
LSAATVLSVFVFDATFADLRWATCLLAWCDRCFVNLLSLTGGPEASPVAAAWSDVAAAASAVCNGPAKPSQSPAAMINAERPLALMFMAISPFASPRLTKNLPAVSIAGQKKGIF